ncbi:endoplasmic reticulum protein SC65-like [Betta splendens]|uniref:Endoplasmic reticulum protein SC65-like n=1 Tax=Betta splendens TaxID=158456 RepID=A0A9W2XGC3_BETSP|nr:endoplasmic reticulum protein SC65-like [Betta splendens]
MKQNLLYHEAYGAEWGLRPEHFAPRTEALRHHNQIVAQRQMLAFAEQNLRLDDEGPEAESPDAEFEGLGDYEEWIYADWRQEKGKGDAGEWDA